jgi:hypothetical protein
MRRDQLTELHYITPIANIASILVTGLISHNRTASVQHTSVAMPEIQDRRARIVVPGGRPLHDYVNLYICARNPMLYKRKAQHRDITVLKISPDVLDLPGVVVTDQNTSSEYARFGPGPTGLDMVDYELIFAEYWTHPEDQILEWRHKSIKCAEVLVPDRIGPKYIAGAYVSCPDSRQALLAIACATAAG